MGEKATKSGPAGYLSVGALALQRSTPGGGAIVAANPAGTPFHSAGDFDFGWSPGIDAAAGFNIFGNESLEARFMYSAMDSSFGFVSPGGFIGYGFTGPGGTTFAADYDTKLTSFELNLRHHFTDQFSVLAGVRHIKIEEDLFGHLNTTVAHGLYSYDNNLLGGQVGAQWSVFDPSKPFQLDLSGKVGAFSMKSDGGIYEYQGPARTFIGSFVNPGVRETTYAAEVGVNAGYNVTSNINVTAGYQLLWVSDVAQSGAAASASILNPSLLRTNVYRDDILFHGFNVGLNIAW